MDGGTGWDTKVERDAIVAQMRENPGRWFSLSVHASKGSGERVAHRLRGYYPGIILVVLQEGSGWMIRGMVPKQGRGGGVRLGRE